MSFINICRDNTDPFYRYKMPPIQSKIEGRGNGIKTAIVNNNEVARALGRPPNYLIKYFGFELGAQTSITKDDRYLVNGAHDAPKLQDTLDGFINKFVLCGSCKNPETDIIITKDDNLIRDCKACGQRTNIDPRHKLASFILKNPPESSKSKKKAATASANIVGGGLSISDIASGNTSKKEATSKQSDEDDYDSDDDVLAKKINAEASALPSSQIVNDDDWAVDVSEEAVRRRAQELENLNLDAVTDFDKLGEWVLEFGKDKSKLPNDVEIYKKASDLNIVEDVETVQVLSQVLFDDDIVEQISQHQGLLSKLITSPDHEKALLGGLERFLGLDNPHLLPSISKILLQIYENDLVSEEVIIDWGSKVSKKYVPKDISKKVKKAAKPFIKWVEEAEEDSDEE